MVIPKGGLPSPMMSPTVSFYQSLSRSGSSGSLSDSMSTDSTASTVKTGRSSRQRRKPDKLQQQQQRKDPLREHRQHEQQHEQQQHEQQQKQHHHHQQHEHHQHDLNMRDSPPLDTISRTPSAAAAGGKQAAASATPHCIDDNDEESGEYTNLTDEALIRKLITVGLWSHNSGKLEVVLNRIGNLMFTSDVALKTARRDAIYRSGGHLAIVQAMKKHPRAKGVQTQGCRALANATWEASDFMEAIASVGGVEVILGAMVAFPGDEVVQICGSCALRNLTSLKKIAKLVLEEDGFPVAVAAMKNFPMNANIQECGCWTIAHVCLDRENKPYIQSARCFGAIGDAADNHPKQMEVQKAARRATERMWAILLER